MRREKMNNKGFSLVELIIVIAIMAILAAALAPQLMKYIEKSRVSTDASTCTSIESCVNAALANEDIYKEVADKAKSGSFVINVTEGPAIDKETEVPKLSQELKDTLKTVKAPKQTGMTKYEVTINGKTTTKNGVAVCEIGDIKVITK